MSSAATSTTVPALSSSVLPASSLPGFSHFASASSQCSGPILRGLPELRLRRRLSVAAAASDPLEGCVRASVTTPRKLGENVISERPEKQIRFPSFETRSLAIQFGALFASVDQPVFAVTGQNNYEEDLTSTLIQAGIVAVWYFIIMPPVIMNWLRVRWYKRKFFEMYLQFMCVFLFFPGILLWAPFLNFRKFPRDPSMKYPWSTPQDLK